MVRAGARRGGESGTAGAGLGARRDVRARALQVVRVEAQRGMDNSGAVPVRARERSGTARARAQRELKAGAQRELGAGVQRGGKSENATGWWERERNGAMGAPGGQWGSGTEENSILNAVIEYLLPSDSFRRAIRFALRFKFLLPVLSYSFRRVSRSRAMA